MGVGDRNLMARFLSMSKPTMLLVCIMFPRRRGGAITLCHPSPAVKPLPSWFTARTWQPRGSGLRACCSNLGLRTWARGPRRLAFAQRLMCEREGGCSMCEREGGRVQRMWGQEERARIFLWTETQKHRGKNKPLALRAAVSSRHWPKQGAFERGGGRGRPPHANVKYPEGGRSGRPPLLQTLTPQAEWRGHC